MVGIPRAKRFNEIVAMDVGELEGRKFLMFVDMDTYYVKETLIRIKNNCKNNCKKVVGEMDVVEFCAERSVRLRN